MVRLNFFHSKRGGAADGIPQLPDIAGPGVALEQLKHARCEAIQSLVYVRQKVLCQKWIGRCLQSISNQGSWVRLLMTGGS